MVEKIELNSLDRFNPHSDPSHIAQALESWLRSFELFVTGKGVTDPTQRFVVALFQNSRARYLFYVNRRVWC